MNTFKTSRHTRLRFLTPGDGAPAVAGLSRLGDQRIENIEGADDAVPRDARYVALPGRDPVDLESLSDLLLD